MDTTQHPPEQESSKTVGQKFIPQAKLPVPEVLTQLGPEKAHELKRILAEPCEYIAHPLFETPADEHALLHYADVPASLTPVHPDDSGLLAVACLAQQCPPALKLDHEHWLFVRFNYYRKRGSDLLTTHAGKRLGLTAAQTLLAWEREAHNLRSQIVRENIALVLAMVKRTRISGVDPSDLVSEGNLALLRAANKFDCSRGYRFSTYACRAILKSFSRVATRTSRYRGRFPTEFDPALEKSQELVSRRVRIEEDCVENLRSVLDRQLGNLSDVERTVIRARFALDQPDSVETAKGRTLEQVGVMIGVTKERVRQIQNKALRKLRVYLNQAVFS